MSNKNFGIFQILKICRKLINLLNDLNCIYFAGVVVDGHSVEYIVSARGKIQLLIDSYPYYRYLVEKDKITYKCVQNRVLGFVIIFFKNDMLNLFSSIIYH